jgi:hypothetical protein
MKKAYLLSPILIGLVALAGIANRIQAQSNKIKAKAKTTIVDQLDYSACGCTPRSQDAFHNFGVGANGFFWDTDHGAWLNLDGDNREILSCPIPFDHRLLEADGTPRPVKVLVNVIDSNDRQEVLVELMGQTASGEATLLAFDHTSEFFDGGPTSLTVLATPDSKIRYLWLRVNVPSKKDGKTSGVKGYQVSRP